MKNHIKFERVTVDLDTNSRFVRLLVICREFFFEIHDEIANFNVMGNCDSRVYHHKNYGKQNKFVSYISHLPLCIGLIGTVE